MKLRPCIINCILLKKGWFEGSRDFIVNFQLYNKLIKQCNYGTEPFIIIDQRECACKIRSNVPWPSNASIKWLLVSWPFAIFMNTSPGNLLTFPPNTSGFSSKWQACQWTSQQLSLRPNGYWNNGSFMNIIINTVGVHLYVHPKWIIDAKFLRI